MNQTSGQGTAIAIVGIAGRFPKARNVDAFWHNLRSGVEAISFFSDEELREAGVRIPEDQTNFVKARAVLEDADKFDAEFFGINPKEAEIMDPQHRLFLETAWEALENAGYVNGTDDRLIGVYAGMSMNSYLLTNLCSRPDVMDLAGTYQIMLGNDKDYLPTRVSYKLNLRGPSVNIQTACSTSLVAVCVACEQLLSYQCDLALAGGVSVTFPQKRGYLYQEGGISSQDGHCRAFDAQAQGTVSGDGVGIVVLKRLAEALQDRDHIYAVIKGFATNNDGSMKAGYTAPSPDGQAEVIALAQAISGVAPESIGYIVAHGTGTPLGDPIEIEGLTKAFRAGTDAKHFCAVTSVKTNIGHLDAAAGIAGLLNAVLALYHKQIPPSLHYHAPNPKIDFASSPFFVNSHLREWTPPLGVPRRAGVSSFGIGGTNAHVIIEEPPPLTPRSESRRSANLLLLSARTESALQQSAERLATHLEGHNHINTDDMAYTLATGRAAFQHRRAVVCRDNAQAISGLRALDPNCVITGQSTTTPSVAFMFPGQGAQYVNMGLELYRLERVFREQIDGCSDLLRGQLGLDLRDVLYPKTGKTDQASEQLMQTAVAQPALFSIEYALAKLWMSWGIEPESLIGHSIGEYVAACVAGVFSLKDALHLVALRGNLMQRLPKGAMLAVRLSEAEAQRWLTAEISLAAVNSVASCVLSGPSDAIDSLAERLRTERVAAQRLHTSHAFHSAMVDPIRSTFAQAVQRVHLRSPRIPYVSNLTGDWITAEQATSPGYWADHLRQSVRFADGLGLLLTRSPLCLLEAGPGRTLSTFARQHPAKHAGHTIAASLPQAKADQADDYRAILLAAGQIWVAGAELDWQSFYGKAQHRRVVLPTYPFEQKRHWVEPGQAVSANANVCAVIPASPPAVAVTTAETQPNVLAEHDLVAAPLKALFSELSGLKISSIDSRTSFTELGFDSLFLTQASQAIEKRFGVKIPFGQLLEQFSTIELLATHLLQSGDMDRANPTMIQPLPPAEPSAMAEPQERRAPLTEAQKEIWFAVQYGDDASCAFNESNLLYLRGTLEIESLRNAIQSVVERHDSLRMTFSADGEFQEVQSDVQVATTLVDLSSEPPSEQQKQLDTLLSEEATTPFNLVVGPLLRCRLIKFGERLHGLLLTVHHIVCDGASIGVLLNEMSEIYSADRRGLRYELPASSRFVDFARKQAGLKNSPERQKSEQFWLEQFKTLPPHLELPLDFSRPAHPTFGGGWEYRPLNTQLCRELSRISAAQRTTLFVTFLAAYYVFLHRLTGQDEIVIGVPSAERSQDGTEKLVGHCINFLPLRSELRGNQRFVDYLAELRSRFVAALEHQNYTFGSLLQKLQMARDRSRTPLVSAMFNMVWVRSGLDFAGLAVELKPNPMSSSNFELAFNITEADGTFALDCSFKSELLRGATVKQWMKYFETLLEGIVANPEQLVSKLPLLPAEERQQIFSTWTQRPADQPQHDTVPELVMEQAKRTPNAIAASAGSATLTYRQLVSHANTLAARLRAAGVKQGTTVAMLIPASLDMLIAVIAVLQAGGVLLALDGLISDLWNTSLLGEATVLLGTSNIASRLKAFSGKFIAVDQPDASKVPGEATSRIAPESLAVLVSSGTASNLRLKGFSHRSLVNVVYWLVKNSAATEGTRTLQIKRPGTERFLHELFATWCSGGRLVIPPAETRASDLADVLARENAERAFLSSAQLAALRQSITSGALPPPGLREIIVHSGEPPLSSDLLKLKQKMPNCTFFVLYDSAATGVATAYRLNGEVPTLVRTPIGRPISNVQVFVLDEELNPVPPGISGRLFVTGDSLADDFKEAGPEPRRQPNGSFGRLVETGDLARYRVDGTIELIQLQQSAVEIEGWRIDLASLRAVLVQYPEVSEAVLVIREDAPGEKQLVAYVVTRQKANEAEIIQLLQAQLPRKVEPSVVFVESLPTNSRGQIDVTALASPRPSELTKPVLPRSSAEKILAQIWCEVIGLESAGVHDNFFELGGHSVLVTQVVARIRKAFQVEISLRTIFERPTIAELAEMIEQRLMEEISAMSEEEANQMVHAEASVGKESA